MPLWIISALGLAKQAGSGLLRLLSDWRVLGVLALAGVVVFAVHEARRADRLQGLLSAETKAFAQEHQAFTAERAHSHALVAARGQDHAAAVSDATASARACDARVSAARKSAAAIHQLLNEPAHAPSDPAEPELLSGERLWNATGGR